MGRKTLTEPEIAARRETVLKAARTLFAKNGYRYTTMRQIAELAGISLGSLYYYFENKSDIYLILYSEGLDRLKESFEDAFSIPAPDVTSRLSILIYSYVNFYKNNYESYHILSSGISSGNREVDVPDELTQKGIDILHMLETPIKEGIASGEIRPCDSFNTTVSLWVMFDGILMMPEKTHIELLSEHFQDYYSNAINLVLNGMLDEKGKRRSNDGQR